MNIVALNILVLRSVEWETRVQQCCLKMCIVLLFRKRDMVVCMCVYCLKTLVDLMLITS